MTTKSGIDLSHVDGNTRPQDDLFEHVNGQWLTEYTIPADRAVDGAFRHLYDKAEEDVKNIIIESAESSPPEGTDAHRVGDIYASFMAADDVEAAGLTPIASELAEIADAADKVALAATLARLERTGVGGAVAMYVNTDAKDSSRYLAYFTQSGLGLPDESYYRDDEYAETREKYVAHLGRMFGLANLDYSADTVMALETKLAAG
ncbi:MAG: peptidase M13, partial [Rhodococcus sp.]|nr:peptidase M13 [Rhodococcus sp. (in: high G+C Gram-positive bacteria)]